MSDLPLPNTTPEEREKVVDKVKDVFADGKITLQEAVDFFTKNNVISWPRRIAYVMSVLAFFGITFGVTKFASAPPAPAPAPDVKPDTELLDAIKGMRGDMQSFGKTIIEGQGKLETLIKDNKPKPPVPPASPTISAPKTALPGEMLKTSWTLPSGSRETVVVWLSADGAKDERYADGTLNAASWRYTGGKPGTFAIDLGHIAPGKYELRLGEWAGVTPEAVFARSQLTVMGMAPQPPPKPPEPKPPEPKPPEPKPPAPVSLNEFGKLVYAQVLKVGRKQEAIELAGSYSETTSAIAAGGINTPSAAVKMLYERNKGILGANAQYWVGFFAWLDNELTRRNELGSLSTMPQHADHFGQISAAMRKAGE